MKKIYYLVASQYDNLGDLVINKMLIEEISKFGDVYIDSFKIPEKFEKFLYSNENTKNFNNIYNRSLKSKSIRETLSVIKILIFHKFDYLFMSPGPQTFRLNLRYIFLAIFLKILSLKGIKVVFVGNEFASFKRTNLISKLISSSTYHFFVRSKENTELFIKNKINNVTYIPDLAFLLFSKVTKERKTKKEKILLSFRTVNEYELLIKSLRNIIINLKDYQKYQIEIFHQVKRDYLFNKRIAEDLYDMDIKFRDTIVWYDDLAYYNNASYIISNRLHVLLIGMQYGAVPIGIIYNNKKTEKLIRIFKSINLNNLIKQDYNENEIVINKNIKEILHEYSENNENLCRTLISRIFIN